MKGHLKARKAGNFERAVTYMDVKGALKSVIGQIEEEMKDMSSLDKEKAQEIIEKVTLSEMRDGLIELCRKSGEDPAAELAKHFEIVTTKKRKGGRATVIVKFTGKDGSTSSQGFPVTKAGAFWKIDVTEDVYALVLSKISQ